MTMKRIPLIIMLLILAAARTAMGADYTTTYRDCTINWTRGVITTTATANLDADETGQPVDFSDRSPLSLNRARSDAAVRAREAGRESVMAAVRTIRIDPGMRIKDLLATDDTLQRRLAEALNSFAKYRTYPSGHGGSVCELSLGIGDVVASLPYDFPREELPVIDDTPLKTDYTSLLIDCRGLGLEPMIFPSVYNDDGVEVYGRKFVDSAIAAKYGTVAFCGAEEEARSIKRAGGHPLFTIALKSVHGNPVISNRDARRILGSTVTRNNLKKCRVILILDRKETSAMRTP